MDNNRPELDDWRREVLPDIVDMGSLGAVSMGDTVTCSNIGFCGLANRRTPLAIHLGVCPRCAKLLASPHHLSITVLPDAGSAANTDRVEVRVERLAYPAEATDLWLEVDGEVKKRENPGPIDKGYVGIFDAELNGGSRLIAATLKTADERWSTQSLRWFGARESILPITLAALVLLLLAIVSLWANFEIGALLKSPGTAAGWLATLLSSADSRNWALLATGAICLLASAWLFLLSFRLADFGRILWGPLAVILVLLLRLQVDLLRSVGGSVQAAIGLFFAVAVLITLSLIVPRLWTKGRSA